MRGKIVGLIIYLIALAFNVHAQPAGPEFYDDLSLLPYIYPNVESLYLSAMTAQVVMMMVLEELTRSSMSMIKEST